MSTLARVSRHLRSVGKGIGPLSRDDARVLIAMLAVALCVWGFVILADAVADKRTQDMDERLLRALRDPVHLSTPRGPRWVAGVMRDLTSLGSAPCLALFVLAVAGSLVARRQLHALALLFVATLGGEALNLLLKGYFDRPRPDIALHLAVVESPRFPSVPLGHAMESAVVYFPLAALLARLVEPRPL